jgi:DNA-binding NtrC family response regulator
VTVFSGKNLDHAPGRDGRPASVLLVDRDPDVARRILAYLKERNYVVDSVDDGEKAFNLLDSRLFDVLIADLNIRRVDGLRLMAVARDRNPDICVIFITEHTEIDLATEAMRQGAYDFQVRPVNLGKLEAVIQRGLNFQQLVLRQHEMRRRLDERYGLGSLVGNSRQMVRVYDAVRQAAPNADPVLIQGESGTGKDLIAQAIHTNSPRRDEAFVKVQCAGGPGHRLHRELFGDPAAGIGQGKIELADHGTLYLDEVDALDPGLQAAFTSLIDYGRVQKPGEKKTLAVDVRIIASSCISPGTVPRGIAVFQRSGTFHIDAPALRDRPEDIPLLTNHFLEEIAGKRIFPVPKIMPRAMDLLMRYNWPGNVRELKNLCEGLALLTRGEREIDAYDVPEHLRLAASAPRENISIVPGTTMAEIERIVIAETLKMCGYNKTACAKKLDIGLRTLYRKLKELEIS